MSNDRTKAIRAAIIDMVDAKIALHQLEQIGYVREARFGQAQYETDLAEANAKLHKAADRLEAALDTSPDTDDMPSLDHG